MAKRNRKNKANDVMSDSAWREGRTGLMVIILFFGGLIGFGSLAPLDAAVVAQGFVRVSGNRVVLQHRDGGTISRVNVEEGDEVARGQVLLDLSTTELRARERSLFARVIELQASRARLLAELAEAETIEPPLAWSELGEDERAQADAVLERQQRQMDGRYESLRSRISVLEQRESQLEARIQSYEEQTEAVELQARLIREEIRGLRQLERNGFAPTLRVREAERNEAELTARLAELRGLAEQAREAIGESELEALSVTDTRTEQIEEELRQIDTQLASQLPELESVRSQIARAQLTAPVAGVVVGLEFFNEGAVVLPGERVLDIVPEGHPLVIEARIAPRDADNLWSGQATDVRFAAFEGRQIPMARGEVTRLSADSFEDDRTGLTYFTAEVQIESSELERLSHAAGVDELPMRAGLPVEVIVPLRSRTALQYIVEPLNRSIWQSFREH